MRKLLFILVTCLLLGGCSPSTKVNSKTEDFKKGIAFIQKNHSALYESISEEEFTRKCKEVEDKLEKQSDIENYYSIKELIASIHNAHTVLYYDISSLPIYGFTTQYFNDGLRIMAIEKNKQEYLGYEIKEINGLSLEEVFNRFEKICCYDTEAWKYETIYQEMSFVDAYKYLGITDNDQITVTVQNGNDEKDLTFSPITKGNIQEKLGSLTQFKPKKIASTFKNDPYYSVQDINDILYIQYNQCKENPDYPMVDFMSDSFSVDIQNKLNTKKYDKVVIDLRYNSGGNSAIIKPVLQILQKGQATNNFKLYTLIGSGTFSSGLWNAVDTISDKYGLNATLVGMPTGGNLKSAGDLKVYEMEILPFSIYYPYKYFDMIPGKSGSLQPDVKIPFTFEDYQNGKDPVFEYIIKQ